MMCQRVKFKTKRVNMHRFHAWRSVHSSRLHEFTLWQQLCDIFCVLDSYRKPVLQTPLSCIMGNVGSSLHGAWPKLETTNLCCICIFTILLMFFHFLASHPTLWKCNNKLLEWPFKSRSSRAGIFGFSCTFWDVCFWGFCLHLSKIELNEFLQWRVLWIKTLTKNAKKFHWLPLFWVDIHR